MIRNYVRETKERVTVWLVMILLGMVFVAFLQAHGVTFNLFVSFWSLFLYCLLFNIASSFLLFDKKTKIRYNCDNQNLFFERRKMFKKVMFLLAILCLVSSTMFGCQTIKPQVAKGEVKPPLQIMSIPSTIEYSELVISAVIYPTERGTITGIDQLSIPEDVQVDIIKGEYVLLRTKYKNLGSSGEIKLIIDDKRISLEQFVFSENNSIETVRILKNLGMRAPSPVLSDSLIISLKKSIRSINTPLYFSDDGVHALLKNDIRITPSKHGLVNSGEIDLPAIPKEISILTDDWFHVNLEYFYNGKSYLKFTSDTARYLDKILITFEDGNFILTDLVLDNGMGKG